VIRKVPFSVEPNMNMKRLVIPVGLALLLCGVVGPALAQQVKYQAVRGTLTDAASTALVGHRVLFLPADGGQSFLSQPTRTDGTYIVSLPDGTDVVPIAVINPRGVRMELGDEAPLTVVEGVRRDISLPESTESPAEQIPDSHADVTGSIRNADGEALVGYRVVFRSEGGYEVHVSGPGDDNGEYTARLPLRGLFVPVAIIDPRGHRRSIDDDNPVQAIVGARRDVTYQVAAGTRLLPEPPFQGADRLFISFVEDLPVVEHYRAELRLDFDDFDNFDVSTGKAVGAIQLSGLPDVELGASIGFGESDIRGADSSESGLTDLELWGKLHAGPRASGVDWGFGFVVNLPTGEEQPGLGADALSTKLFYSERRALGWAVLSYNVGVEFNEDGEINGTRLDGQVAPSLGAALIFPTSDRISIVTELYASGERFDDQGEDVRLLGGVNWKVGNPVHVRGAVAFGLADGAPDLALTLGLAFDY
jgi:hypothetical protein